MAVAEATLFGGPAAGKKLMLRGVPAGQWPAWTCVNMRNPRVLAQHYRHIAGGVYEHQGACAEFDHGDAFQIACCPECGAQILGHPETGHRE